MKILKVLAHLLATVLVAGAVSFVTTREFLALGKSGPRIAKPAPDRSHRPTPPLYLRATSHAPPAPSAPVTAGTAGAAPTDASVRESASVANVAAAPVDGHIEPKTPAPERTREILGFVLDRAAATARVTPRPTGTPLADEHAASSATRSPNTAPTTTTLAKTGTPAKTGTASAAQAFAPIPGQCLVGFDAVSSLHDFSGSTSAVTGLIRLAAAGGASDVRGHIAADAATLTTGHEGRDEKMRTHHLDTPQFPKITFTFASIDPAGDRPDVPRTVRGRFCIHGIEREVQIPTELTQRQDGLLHLKGSLALQMTDFGITPPSLLVITVQDKVTAWFDLWLEPTTNRE